VLTVKRKVLIADDAKFIREKLKEIFENLGFEVAGEAYDGDSAVNLYEKIRPDLVTMDILMPNKNGIDALREIKEKDPDAKVIIITTLGQENMVIEALETGADEFIVKPFKKKDITTAIKRLFDEY
jgi:two-component system chemotaxis response regulator CheY